MNNEQKTIRLHIKSGNGTITLTTLITILQRVREAINKSVCYEKYKMDFAPTIANIEKGSIIIDIVVDVVANLISSLIVDIVKNYKQTKNIKCEKDINNTININITNTNNISIKKINRHVK